MFKLNKIFKTKDIINNVRFDKTIQKFFAKVDQAIIEEKPVDELTYLDIKDHINQAENNILNGTYYLNNLPDNNYFGEIPIYIAPNGVFNNSRTIELSGVLFTTTLTLLSYSKLLFNHYIFTPYFGLMAFTSLIRYITKFGSEFERYILRISLIDENKIKIVFINGKVIETNIRNIHINTSFLNNLNSMIDKRTKNNKNIPDNNFNRGLNIALTIDTVKQSVLIIKNISFTPGKLTEDNLAYINHNIFYGILNKKTKRLALKEDK